MTGVPAIRHDNVQVPVRAVIPSIPHDTNTFVIKMAALMLHSKRCCTGAGAAQQPRRVVPVSAPAAVSRRSLVVTRFQDPAKEEGAGGSSAYFRPMPLQRLITETSAFGLLA